MRQDTARPTARGMVMVWAGLTLVATAIAAAQVPPPAAPQGRRGAAQRQAGQAGAPQAGGQYTLAEVQQMFDAMTLMQAEQALKLTDAQYPAFLSKLRALQQVRRRIQVTRLQVTQQLAKLTAPGVDPIDEAQVRDRLKALADLDARAVTDLKAAYDGIDQLLNVWQQARFRVLEQQIERRKLELLARARRGAGVDELPPADKIIK